MKDAYRKSIAAFLVAAGLIQAIAFSLQDTSPLSLLGLLGGIGFALAGVLFWVDVRRDHVTG